MRDRLDSPPPRIGLDRLPHDLQRLLEDAAAAAERRAASFHAAVATAAPAALDELAGGRTAVGFAHRLRHAQVSSGERGRLLMVVRALDETLEALEHAARAAIGCDCGERAVALAAVVRDAVRVEARALRLFVSRAEPTGRDRVAELEREGRLIQRAARAEAAMAVGDPLDAIRRMACMEQIGRALDAAAHAVDVIERACAGTA